MRINNSGTYEYCRWMDLSGPTRVNFENNLKTVAPLEYFQNTLAPLRQAMLDGETVPGCKNCKIMEQSRKVSGRQRQLLKIGVMDDYWVPSFKSSTFGTDFDYSQEHNGHTLRTVSDWQIDLGNYCNSACIFCAPESSSRLATEFQQLGLTDSVPPPAWCDDPVLLNKFIEDLKQSPNLQYLHFIGGETIITPGFKKILEALIDSGLNKNVTVGFTTNLTVWAQDVVDLLVQFKQINLGMSVEALNSVNEYVRWPAKLGKTFQLLERWRRLGEANKWLIQLRITPTCLTVHALDTVYEYAYQHRIAVESCNFLDNPKFLRIGVLPREQREQAKERINIWLASHPENTDHLNQIINTRDPNRARSQIFQDAKSYLGYLDTVDDESFRLPDLVKYLKTLEGNRKNSVLAYVPQYENILRSAGY